MYVQHVQFSITYVTDISILNIDISYALEGIHTCTIVDKDKKISISPEAILCITAPSNTDLLASA